MNQNQQPPPRPPFDPEQKIKIRVEALRLRKPLLDALKCHGTLCDKGEFIEVTAGKFAELQRQHPAGVGDGYSLSDRVELGLCGKYREEWVKAGSPLREQLENDRLKAICTDCNHTNKFNQLCRNHHCTHAGRWAATWSCPLGKWVIEQV